MESKKQKMPRKPIYFTPKNALKEKAGSGGLPPHVLHKGQIFLESNPIDFIPHAKETLKCLIAIMQNINSSNADESILFEITKLTMQLKANGSMFHYQLISIISDVFLRLLERVKTPDKDFYDILNVYVSILSIVIEKKLTGNGGLEGHTLTEELHNACERYTRKHRIS